jgi:predicted PurR-regulated permease PerM
MTRPSPAVATPLWILAVVAAIFLLRMAAPLLIPIIVAVLISYALDPIVSWAARHHVPRTLAATLLMLLIVGGIGWGAYSLQDNAKAAVQGLPEAAMRARQFLARSQNTTPARELRETVDVLNGTSEADQAAGGTQPAAPRGGQSGTARSPGTRSASPPARSTERPPQSERDPSAVAVGSGEGSPTGAIAAFIQRALGSTLALAGNATVVGFLTLFLLIGSGHFRTRAIEVAGADPERRQMMAKMVDDINTQIQRYLVVQLITASIVGVVTWLVLAWMGIGQALVWGMLAGLLNAIPYFGPIVVSGGLFAVALVQGDHAGDARPGRTDAHARHLHRPAVLLVAVGRMGNVAGRPHACRHQVGRGSRRAAETAQPSDGSLSI